MSVSNSRHSLLAYFSSKSLGKRFRSRIAAVARSAKRHSLRMEALERRELMASDVGGVLHNALVPTDVNGDFEISPIDVLQVINAINRQSRGVAASSDDSSGRPPMADVNKDGSVSPIDALMVINRLKTGEGVGELAEVGVQVLNSSGTVLTPTIGAGDVPEYRLAPGERFSVRTQTRDIRSNPEGVFSSYVDINYATQGSATTELVEVLWGEVQTLSFSRDTNGGTFSLKYGSETTAPITYSTNLATTRNNIASAIGALSFVGGTSNVRVVQNAQPAAPSTEGPFFDIFFTGSLTRQNITDVEVASSSLTVVGGGTGQLTVSSVANPANKLSLSSAISYPVNPAANGNSFSYGTLPFEGTLVSGPTGFRIDNGGGALGGQPTLDDASVFANVFDTAFRASSSNGIVDFTVGPSGSSRLTVLLFGSDTAVADNLITFPKPFRVIVASDLFAANDTASVLQDSGATSIVVGANDTALAGTSFTITSVGTSSGGTAVAVAGTSNQTSAISFTPTAGFSGQTTFTYTITNDQTPPKTSTATVTVNVNAPNNPPVPLTTALNATEAGLAVTFTSTQLFSPGNGAASQTVTLSNPVLVSGEGIIALASGNVSYTPASNDFFGPVVFTVDGTDNGNPVAATKGTFTITVADVNDAPIVKSSSMNGIEDTPATILASDLFSPGPANESPSQSVRLVSASAVSGQTGGTISVVDGNAQFAPAADFFGTFLFVAVAEDTGSPVATSSESTFTINVAARNDAPRAVDDTGAAQLTAPGVEAIVTDLNVMANDDGGPNEPTDTIRITAVTQPASGGGTVDISSDGTRIRFTPNSSSIGQTIRFTYTITDSEGLTDIGTADVAVVAPREPFAVNDSVSVAEDTTTQTVINVLANDLFKSGSTRRLVSLGTLSPSTAGSIAIRDNGTPSDTSDDTIGFTPTSDFFGTASFTYVMTDSGAGSPDETGTVFVTVTEINDAPTVTNQSANGTEDTELTIQSSTLLAGSSAGTNESSQTLTITNVSVQTANAGTAVLTGGNVVFTPASNFNGTATLLFTATDNGQNNGVAAPLSATATITVNVAPVNDAPIAANDSGTTAEGANLTIPVSTLLTNDRPGPATASDEASQTLSIVSVAMASGAAGSIAIVGTNVVFTPPQFFNGTSSATYVIQDSGTGNPQATGTINFTVTPVNNAPVPVAATRTANATIPVNFDLSAEVAQASKGGGADEAGQTVRITGARKLSANGNTVTFNPADGTIRYVAAAGFSGADQIEYTVTDDGTTNGQADPRTGTAVLTVNVAAFVPSSVSGQVWIDDDRDTTKDSDELRLGGVEMILTGRAVGATSDITPIRKLTRTDGTYTFDGLSPGNYIVTFTPPTKLVDAPAPNSIALTIAAPGGTNTVQDFAVYGFETGYSHLLDNLESNYYLRNGQEWRQRGLTSLILPNGTSAWTAHHGGFEGFQSESLRMAADGIYLRVVQANSSVLETKLPRNMYVSCLDGNGNTLVRVFATQANLSFAPVINSPGDGEGESYASSVDRFFSQLA